MRAGIDTGGTFTDFVFWDGHRASTHKVRSTTPDPSEAIATGLNGRRGISEIVHGSTVATNALLERRGAATAFVTTDGFKDLLTLARQNRAALYDWSAPLQRPLAEPQDCFELPERVLADGSVEHSLAPQAVERLAAELHRREIRSVAVCLLHSYANPVHERIIGETLRAAGLCVSLSHEVLPEYREYERAATTTVNAYVSPLMEGYLKRLEERLGATARLRVFGSSGASMSVRTASRSAVHTVLSGPAGGVAGAAAVARRAGFQRIISFDMGGTSTDVSLYDAAPRLTSETVLGGVPIRVPMLDIVSVGAGGGSIARIDEAAALRVGPQSAGASPGPACYGEGDQPTVTDAHLVAGRIDPERFLDGRMRLDVERARRVVGVLAARAGETLERTAAAVIEVATSNMERAVRAVSIERGEDPREYALVAFGGAGALHGCELAERLGMRSVIVPPHAGVLSALGMLVADFARDYSRSILGVDPEPVFAELERRAGEELADEGLPEARMERSIDLRYRGQSYEVTLPWADRECFDQAHRRVYGHAHEGRETERVTARLRATGFDPEAEIYDLTAPAERRNFSTAYVAPGWREREDSAGNLVLEKK